ncbi:MAG: tripartite tricarboxylate transporter substrate binding protein [Pigmentiphaga sp.]|nr:tripartite tricarboxylate transporter substrate binding protein [Pigmentiphaga sp.]
MKLVKVLAATAALAVSKLAFASYPDRMVEIVVPYAPGGGVDVVARLVAERLAQHWKQAVIIQNRPGANAAIGQEFVARAKPDGYTLLITSDSPVTTSPHLVQTLRYDPMRDLLPVTQLVGANLVVLLNAGTPIQTFPELIELAKREVVPYGSFGPASQPHIFFEALAASGGGSFLHVPYRGTAASLNGAIAGEVKLAMGSIAVANTFIQAGRLRGLVISGGSRSALAPDIPTLTELGYAEVDPFPWFGMFAPAGTPPEIAAKIAGDLKAIYGNQEIRTQDLISRGYEPKLSSPDEFRDMLQKEFDVRGKQIRTLGIKLED